MAKSCTTRKVVIKKKNGHKLKTPIVFTGHTGPGCKKPKRSTAHLREYKAQFKIDAKACAKRQGKNWNRKNFNACIKQGMRQAFKNR